MGWFMRVLGLVSLICLFAEVALASLQETKVVTQHSLGGLEYEATAGNLVIQDKAAIYYVYYRAKGLEKNRPITFCFNGGPGASSAWLHLCALGPKRLVFNDQGAPLFPPRLVENKETLLTETDLVFVDPMGTGFSYAETQELAKQFYSYNEDIKCLSDFIRVFIEREQLWLSPKYLVGESYGTTRSVGIGELLEKEFEISLDGVLLISSMINFQTIRLVPGNDTPAPLYIPSYAAVAFYYKKIPGSNLESVLKEAEAFASGPYLAALFQGDALPREEEEKIAKQMEVLIGLPAEVILKHHLRVPSRRFMTELLKGERVVGRFDPRQSGYVYDAGRTDAEYDPSLELFIEALSPAIQDYLARDLNFRSPRPYYVLNNEVSKAWNFDAQNEYLNLSSTLGQFMTKNPRFRVFVGSGLHDFATPYFSSTYMFTHLGLSAPLQKNISLHRYVGGHLFFSQNESFVQLKKDMTLFYKPQ